MTAAKVVAGASNLCRYRISAKVIAQRMGDEAVVVHTGTNRIYQLNATGARIWDLLEPGADRLAIETRLLGEYNADPALLATEIEALLAKLAGEKLIVALPVEADR